MDDFLGVAQGSPSRRKRVKGALLHALDLIFRPLGAHDNPHRQEPASIKKLLQGDGAWRTRKILLGWLIDTIHGTIELPPHRIERLNEILASISPAQKVVSLQHWHKMLGELRSMALAIPGARGLFSLLQEAFRHVDKDRPRIRLSQNVHHILDDFRWMAADIAARPTRIAELIPGPPHVIGACDAAGSGMGGVFFVPDNNSDDFTPYLWRSPFPDSISSDLVSFDNPKGSINNSELELCGNIAHHDVVANTTDIREQTIWTGSDNTASVHWLRKGSATTTGPAAFLLRVQGHHQRTHRYVPLHDYVPGTANAMADFCSRAWHLSDSRLLAHFNSVYPQTRSWRGCHLAHSMFTTLTSSLQRKLLPMASLPKPQTPRTPTGAYGLNSAATVALTHSLNRGKIPSRTSKSSPYDTDKAVSPPARDRSQLTTYLQSSARWHRRSYGWGPRTHAIPASATESLTSAFRGSFEDGESSITRPCESDPSQSPSFSSSSTQPLRPHGRTPPLSPPQLTSSASPSSTSYGLASTPVPPTKKQPSLLTMSGSTSNTDASTLPQRRPQNLRPPRPQASTSLSRKTSGKATPSPMAEAGTVSVARQKASSAYSWLTDDTFTASVPPSTDLSSWRPIFIEDVASESKPLTSQPSCDQRPQHVSTPRACQQTQSAHAPCEPEAPWLYCAAKLTPTP